MPITAKQVKKINEFAKAHDDRTSQIGGPLPEAIRNKKLALAKHLVAGDKIRNCTGRIVVIKRITTIRNHRGELIDYHITSIGGVHINLVACGELIPTR